MSSTVPPIGNVGSILFSIFADDAEKWAYEDDTEKTTDNMEVDQPTGQTS